jgi:hypothetical protein
MWGLTFPPYKPVMPTSTPTPRAELQFAAAGVFLEKLAAAEFDQLAVALEPDATLRALLPRRYREWEGREAVCEAFAGIFGDLQEYAVLDATVGLVGDRLHLSWRLRVRGERLGPGVFVVEQQGYVDAGPLGRLQSMSLVCSGFCHESSAA